MAKENLPTISFKGSEYVLVKDRVIFFNENYMNGAIITEMVKYENGQVIFKATAMPDVDKPSRFFTGHSQAVEGVGYINKTSALENAETSAVGRALGFLGIGVIDGVASADEIAKATAMEKKGKPPVDSDPAWISEGDAKSVEKERENETGDNGHQCRECGAPTTYKEGVSKSGKRYKGYFCTAGEKHKPEWIYD